MGPPQKSEGSPDGQRDGTDKYISDMHKVVHFFLFQLSCYQVLGD